MQPSVATPPAGNTPAAPKAAAPKKAGGGSPTQSSSSPEKDVKQPGAKEEEASEYEIIEEDVEEEEPVEQSEAEGLASARGAGAKPDPKAKATGAGAKLDPKAKAAPSPSDAAKPTASPRDGKAGTTLEVPGAGKAAASSRSPSKEPTAASAPASPRSNSKAPASPGSGSKAPASPRSSSKAPASPGSGSKAPASPGSGSKAPASPRSSSKAPASPQSSSTTQPAAAGSSKEPAAAAALAGTPRGGSKQSASATAPATPRGSSKEPAAASNKASAGNSPRGDSKEAPGTKGGAAAANQPDKKSPAASPAPSAEPSKAPSAKDSAPPSKAASEHEDALSSDEEEAPKETTESAPKQKAKAQAKPMTRRRSSVEAVPELDLPTPNTKIDQLYQEHAQKMRKLELSRAESWRDDLKQIEKWREDLRSRFTPGQLKEFNPMTASQRLYENAAEMRKAKDQKQEETLLQQRAQLRKEMAANLPTKSGKRSNSSPRRKPGQYAPFDRLYNDARRRDRDLKLARDVFEMEQVSTCKRDSENISPRRHHDLYNEAERRRQRLECKKEEVERLQLEQMQRSASAGASRALNMSRIHELHADAACRKRRLAGAMAESQMQELSDIMQVTAQPSFCTLPLSARDSRACSEGGFRKRPSKCDDPRSPRGVKWLPPRTPRSLDVSDTALQSRLSSSTAKPAPPAPAAMGGGNHGFVGAGGEVHAWHPTPRVLQHVIAITDMVRLRCGFQRQSGNNVDKALAEPLQKALKAYSDALDNCKSSTGYAVLSSCPSFRLFRGGRGKGPDASCHTACDAKLVPDEHAWCRNVQPEPIRQVQDMLSFLLKTAEQAQAKLKELVAPEGTWKTGEVKPRPSGVPMALFAYDPGMKLEMAARSKAYVRYGPSEAWRQFRHLTDLARISLVFGNCEMLKAGLSHLMQNFDVIDVRNHFARPGRLGLRFVEVLIAIMVENEYDGEVTPHVCEIRLEEICFYRAQEEAYPHMKDFYRALRNEYSKSTTDLRCMMYLAHVVLTKPAVGHELRIFRNHISKRFGSTVAAWRRVLGNSRLVAFSKFRDLCNALGYAEQATEFWEMLDSTRAGSISLFELDPDAVALLIRFRARILAYSDAKYTSEREEQDPINHASLFARLSYNVDLVRPEQLTLLEFRTVAKTAALTVEEADRVFAHLDFQGAVSPASVGVDDLQWLVETLPTLIDIDACTLKLKQGPSEEEYLRETTWNRRPLGIRPSRNSVAKGQKAVGEARKMSKEVKKQLEQEGVIEDDSGVSSPERSRSPERGWPTASRASKPEDELDNALMQTATTAVEAEVCSAAESDEVLDGKQLMIGAECAIRLFTEHLG